MRWLYERPCLLVQSPGFVDEAFASVEYKAILVHTGFFNSMLDPTYNSFPLCFIGFIL
jgi:hypothetical protein